MVIQVAGELFNFAAYTFAPAVLVDPLGALSVLTGTVLGAYLSNERLDVVGRLGSVMCLVGSALIVANALGQGRRIHRRDCGVCCSTWCVRACVRAIELWIVLFFPNSCLTLLYGWALILFLDLRD